MATISDFVADVLRMISVIAEDESPTATQVTQHAVRLNEMMAQWAAEGKEVGYSPLSAVTDTVTIPDWAMIGAKTGLAILISPEYAKTPDQLIYEANRRAMRVVERMTSEEPVVDTSDLPQGRRPYYFNISSGS